MPFVRWSDLSDAASCENGLTILIIKQFLLARLKEEKIVLSLRARHLPRGIEARKCRPGIRAAIGGTMEDVTGADSLRRFNVRRSALTFGAVRCPPCEL